MLITHAETTVRYMRWYEICEWNGQDTTRTLEHADELLALWTADFDHRSPEVTAACDRIARISQSWRAHHDQPALVAVPCSKIAANFTNREISRVDHVINPGSSRWYAAVVQPGVITSGDVVTVSPPS